MYINFNLEKEKKKKSEAKRKQRDQEQQHAVPVRMNLHLFQEGQVFSIFYYLYNLFIQTFKNFVTSAQSIMIFLYVYYGFLFWLIKSVFCSIILS